MPPCRPRRGVTLVELLVALVLLQLTGAAALAAVLTAERGTRRATASVRRAEAWWSHYREAERAPACHDSAGPRTEPIRLDAPAGAPDWVLSVGCGR